MVKRGLFHRFICTLIGVTMLLSFAACGREETGRDDAPEDADDSVQTAAGQDSAVPRFTGDGEFTIRYVASESLNPFTCDNAYNSAVLSLIYQVFSKLTRISGLKAFCAVQLRLRITLYIISRLSR